MRLFLHVQGCKLFHESDDVNLYCVVHTNGVEMGRTDTQPSTRAPKWRKGDFAWEVEEEVEVANVVLEVWHFDGTG